VKYLFSLVAVGALLLSVSLSASAQTEVSLLVPNPFRGSLDKLIPGFESKTGYKVTVTHGKGLGTRDQVARGEMFDVSILLPPYPEALASGNVDPQSATTLARLTLAVGVKKGGAKPDISTAEALKQTLLAAATIAYVDPTVGSDGFATREALRKLGVLDLVESKSKLGASASVAASFVAKGEADLCIFYLNEMLSNTSVDAIGPLPKQFATPVELVAFISTHARDAAAAKALVEYLSSPEIEAVYRKDGLEPAH
jgi:molybdate transport system substrate-binding protein